MVAMRFSASLARSCATLVAAAAFVLAGCNGGGVAPDKARSQVVAEAAGGSLSGATLDGWLRKWPSAPDKVVGSSLVSGWINTALLIDAVRRNARLDDAATTDSVIANDAAGGMIAQFLIARAARRPPVSDKQVDSVLTLDRVRVFQEIAFRLRSTKDTVAIRKIFAVAQVLAGKLQGGADFTAAVKQYSEDTAGRARNGFLPARAESELPGRLGLWDLPPGGVSAPFGVGLGIHILRRATRDESRPGIRAWLGPRLSQHADSLFIDSLVRARRIVIAPDAPARVRAMALEPVNISEGGALATWKGGSLSPASVRDATMMLTPGERVALSDASDTVAAGYVLGLARRGILLPMINSEPPPDAEARAALAPKYHQLLDSLRAAVKRMGPNVSAADAATQYIDSVLARRTRFLPLPGALAGVLRRRNIVKVNRPVLDGVIAGAAAPWQEAHKNDTTAKRGAAPPAEQAQVP